MGKNKKIIECVCCNNEIEQDNLDGCWKSDKGIFCSQECIAKWFGDEIDSPDDDEAKEIYDEQIELFGKVIKNENKN